MVHTHTSFQQVKKRAGSFLRLVLLAGPVVPRGQHLAATLILNDNQIFTPVLLSILPLVRECVFSSSHT